ncbi:MAG TPA: hypothetical protein VE871_13770 [Longimicrobium sp.]|nr:hypothetical protein [Longimicrobium sp.]
MKALKRLVSSAMLSLALVTGATQAAAQDSLSCTYIGSTVEFGPGYILITDYYVC